MRQKHDTALNILQFIATVIHGYKNLQEKNGEVRKILRNVYHKRNKKKFNIFFKKQKRGKNSKHKF